MMKGAFPTFLDARDLSYNLSFGAARRKFPTFSVDRGLTDWNQLIPNPPAFDTALSYGCTGMTGGDNFTDQYGVVVSPQTLYYATCDYEGHGRNQGCQIRNMLKMTQAYGLDFVDDSKESVTSRGGKYFNIYDDGGVDWFDAVVGSVFAQNIGATIGTPWFASWNSVGRDGVLPMPTESELQSVRNNPFGYPYWHCYAAKGQENDAVQVKAWVGGMRYMPREVFNTVMEIRGSAAFIQPKYVPKDLFTIKLAILDTVLHKYLAMLRLN